MRYQDWGERSARWAGVHSETVDVAGTSVHLLRADAGPDAPPDAPTQLLVHPMAGGAFIWLDVIRPLTALGPVIAPDLPGGLFGDTPAPHWTAVRAEPAARFLRALSATLRLDPVVAHGWSMGGLVALRFAGIAPDRIQRLVLANPALPGPLTTTQRIGWQTVGRLANAGGTALARGLVQVWGRRVIDAKLRYLTEPENLWARRAVEKISGGDPARLAWENISLWTEHLHELRSQPQRMGDAATAWASVVSAMFIDRRPALQAIDRLVAPALVVSGGQDPMIGRAVIDYLMARRPDWSLHVFDDAGHLAPLELPDAYADVVGRWLAVTA